MKKSDEEVLPAIYGLTDAEWKSASAALDGKVDRLTRLDDALEELDAIMQEKNPGYYTLAPTLEENLTELQQSMQTLTDTFRLEPLDSAWLQQEKIIPEERPSLQDIQLLYSGLQDEEPVATFVSVEEVYAAPSVWDEAVEAPPAEIWSHGWRYGPDRSILGFVQDFTQGKDYK